MAGVGGFRGDAPGRRVLTRAEARSGECLSPRGRPCRCATMAELRATGAMAGSVYVRGVSDRVWHARRWLPKWLESVRHRLRVAHEMATVGAAGTSSDFREALCGCGTDP